MPHWLRKLFSREADADGTTQFSRVPEYFIPIPSPPPDYIKSISPEIAEKLHVLDGKIARAKIVASRSKTKIPRKAVSKARLPSYMESISPVRNAPIGNAYAHTINTVLARYLRARRHADEIRDELQRAEEEAERLGRLVHATSLAVLDAADVELDAALDAADAADAMIGPAPPPPPPVLSTSGL